MKNHYISGFLLSVSIFLFSITKSNAQGLTAADYKKALWMTARMYGGQRDGASSNWLVMDHTPTTAEFSNMVSSKGAVQSQFVKGQDFTKDADGSQPLTSGWHDCADHVKFGQTQYYSAYTLLKGYAEFTAGYDDLYTANYSDYDAAGDFTYEGAKGKPDGIPDILNELKYECDYIINCTPNATTFYSQVGDGNLDHQNWVTSPMMAILPKAQGGQSDGARTFVKNPVDASMSSNAAAALALMSRVYAKFDPTYAATCLTHAVYAYTYAKNNHGTVAAGSFYPANAHWEDDYASACAELYWATGTASYKTEALGLSSSVKDHNYCYNYNNNDDVAAYNLAKLGDATSKTLLTTFATRYIAAVTSGLYNGGDGTWGPLRYNANAAFIVALYEKLNNVTTGDAFIYAQLDYILGKNSSNYSFVVGFNRSGCSGCTSSKQPHHRNVYLSNGNSTSGLTIPTRNAQFGYMVGGNRTASTTEDITQYQTQEGGIDYSAGLVGALGYVNSKLAPVDTNKFGHPTPQLGSNQSICGLSSIVLNSKVATDGKKTFTWSKDGTVTVSSVTTATTYTVTAAGVYKCQIDSAGKWSTSGTVTITAVIPTFSLGADAVLCNPTTDTLKTGASGSGLAFQWKKNGTVLSGATVSSYIAASAGTYIATISATGCSSVADTIVITSNLPTVVNDTICAAGAAPLSVTSTGTFAWYSAATGGTALATGSTYTPTVSATTTYYVQDAGSVSVTVAPVSIASSLTGATNGGNVGVKFTAAKAFTITSMNILPYVYSCGSTDNVSVTIDLQDGTGTKIASYTSSLVPCTGVQSGTPFNTYYTVTFNPAISITAAGDYILMPNGGNALVWFNGGANYTTMSSAGTGVITITGTTRTDVANNYPGMFDIKVQAGSSCGRAPVQAVVNPSGTCTDTQAPTTPGAITFGTVTTTSIVVNWTASTDNVGVTAYELYMNGALQTTVTSGTTATISGLTCNTSYAFKVRAKDAAGNYSAFTTEVSQTTANTAAPTVTTPVNYCQNATASALTATGTALKWYAVATGGTALSSAPTPVTTATGTTNYYVSQTVSSCESPRTTLAVTVNAIPTASAGSAVSICTGQSTTLTASGGTTYAWSNGTATVTNIVTPTATTTYTVTASNTGGCTSTSSVVVTVNAFPTASAGSAVSICTGKSTTLTASGGTSYLWSNGTATATNIVTPTATTTYTVTASNAGGCTSTSSVVVTVNALPTASAGSAVSICSGTATTLTASGGTAYAWSNGTATATNIVTPTATTTYTVTASNAGGCTSTSSVVVTVNAIPAAPTVSSPVDYVLNATASVLTATGTALKWYTVATGGTGSTTAPTPSTTVTGTTSYYVSQTVATCESPRATIAVVISSNIPPTVSITAPATNATFASPASITLTATASDADGTIASVKFYNGTTLLTTITSSPYTYSWTSVAGGAYTVTAVATDNSGGTTTSSPITILVTMQQTISLAQGWNIISFNVQPADSTVATIFGSLGTALLTVKNQDGFYDPSQLSIYNSLQTIAQGQGYLVNMKTAQTLTVTGLPLNTASLSLKTGWNLIGYPKQASGAISTVLSGIWTPFVTMKNFDGFYQNGGTLNSLSNFVPGSGYFIKVNAACVLGY